MKRSETDHIEQRRAGEFLSAAPYDGFSFGTEVLCGYFLLLDGINKIILLSCPKYSCYSVSNQSVPVSAKKVRVNQCLC
jgi:hypothetical protein